MSERHPWDVPTSETLSRQDTGWTPRFEQGIPSDRPFNDSPSPPTENWVTAPPGSHISRFMYVDARDNSLQRKFGRRYGEGGSSNPFSSGASELRVVFKGKEGRGEDSEYAYYFNRHDLGRDIFERMSTSPHPYGEILYPEVVKNKSIPYQRLSKL